MSGSTSRARRWDSTPSCTGKTSSVLAMTTSSATRSIAGHLDGGEEVTAAMRREARQEAGIEIAPEDLRVVGVMHRKSTEERIDFFLSATAWSGEITNREPTKCDQLAWLDMDRLPENVIPYVRRALENYRRGWWFDSFGWS